MNLLLIGPPGSGKGTLAQALAEKKKLCHISTGDIFRLNIKNETQLGQKVKAYIERGELVPDSLTIDLVLDRLDQEEGYILDGFPRNLDQAHALDSYLEQKGAKLDLVIKVLVDEDALVKRICARRLCSVCNQAYNLLVNAPQTAGLCDACGGKVIQRPDDNEETIRTRLATYEAETLPLLKYYEKQSKLKSFSNNTTMQAFIDTVVKALKNYD